MSKPVTVTNTFALQTGPIPLSQLDTNFAQIDSAINDTATYSNYYVDSSGAPNQITVTIAGLAFAYTAGTFLQVKLANTNTSTTVNVNVNALGNQLVLNNNGTAPAVGSLLANSILLLQYDGTVFRLLGSATAFGQPIVKAKTSSTNRASTSTMTNDPDLTYAVAGAGTFKVEIIARPIDQGGGIKANLNFSGTQSNSGYNVVGFNSSVFSLAGPVIGPIVNSSDMYGTAAGPMALYFSGILVATGAGTLAMAWSQQISNVSATIMNSGSFMIITQLV